MVATLLNHNKQLLAQAGSIGQGDTTAASAGATASLWASKKQNISKETLINNIKNNYNSNTISRYFNDIP
ncbi:hypothetical protein [Sphingobacterium sp. T2]|uniref:hypothetical protein n=1 Tax=Sphingobacterium sp. T2 TaxID=1590596 RepID=UPI000691E29A|nr:hypothetical protein [Sphingobacterium sp. T2]